MSGKRITDAERNECLRIRVEERLGLASIARRLRISKSSASVILRATPLTDAEVSAKLDAARRAQKQRPAALGRDRATKSPYFDVIAVNNLSTNQKAAIAEAAVIFRLCIRGVAPLRYIVDGERSDVVAIVGNRARKIQVKCCQRGRNWSPTIPLRARHGRRMIRYDDGDWDFIVGYDLFTDICYVLSSDDARGKSRAISVRPEWAERWDVIVA
jgi:hypothetical protein